MRRRGCRRRSRLGRGRFRCRCCGMHRSRLGWRHRLRGHTLRTMGRFRLGSGSHAGRWPLCPILAPRWHLFNGWGVHRIRFNTIHLGVVSILFRSGILVRNRRIPPVGPGWGPSTTPRGTITGVPLRLSHRGILSHPHSRGDRACHGPDTFHETILQASPITAHLDVGGMHLLIRLRTRDVDVLLRTQILSLNPLQNRHVIQILPLFTLLILVLTSNFIKIFSHGSNSLFYKPTPGSFPVTKAISAPPSSSLSHHLTSHPATIPSLPPTWSGMPTIGHTGRTAHVNAG